MESTKLKSKQIIEVLPGLYQISIPIPIESLRNVFAYLAVDGDHNLLIDTGWSSEAAREALRGGLESLGLSFTKIEKIVVSHLHPDHFGLAQEIKESSPNSRLIMHKADAAWILKTKLEFEQFLSELFVFLRLHGMPNSELTEVHDSSLKMLSFFTPPKPNFIAEGGEILEVGDKWKFRIIHTPGHTAGNLCLYDIAGSNVLFSGDHILPTITPNVSLSPRYNGDPLGDYIDSLTSLKKLDVESILPSHEYVFRNLGRRIDDISFHHKERLDEVLLTFKESPKEKFDAYNVSKRIRWKTGSWDKISAWERRAALMETLAHLQYLKKRGKLKMITESGIDGKKIRYTISKSR
jgi:glyoxylase-like metal-dependent hydrolase (beta-lactamase superfamily II)